MPPDPAPVPVACAADATAPTPPPVLDNCGRTLTVSAGVPSADPPCAGNKTWTFTYTDCANKTYPWVYTYTIADPVVTMPPDPAPVPVACAADATAPTPPPVLDNCGRTLTVSAGVPSADPPCAGNKTWTFTYTDCANKTYPWVYTYTIADPVVTMPPDPAPVPVACAADATAPTPPPVLDNCGRTLTVSAGVPSADPPCAGNKTWTFTYTDCANKTYPWVYTYTIADPVVTMPPDPAPVPVACAADATAPTPPPVLDNCGRTLTVSAGVPSADPPCAGNKTWTFTYTNFSKKTSPHLYPHSFPTPLSTNPPDPAPVPVACAADATAPTP